MRVSVYLLSVTLTCALAASMSRDDVLEALVKEVRDIKEENNDLKAKVNHMENEEKERKSKEKERESKVVALETEVSALLRQQRIMIKKLDQHNPVLASLPYFAFTAYVTTNKYYNLNTPEVISFEALTQNVGDGFDLAGNRFRCPIDGYYEFFGTLQILGATIGNCGSWDCGGTFSVHKAGEILYSEKFEGRGSSSVTDTFKFHLNPFCLAGEELWITFVRTGYYGWSVVGNEQPNSYFSGHLLREG